MKYLIILILLIAFVFTLFRFGFFVIDRNVFDFQINPIIRKGKISNLRDYKVVHNFIEQTFEKDPRLMENNPKIDVCNKLMADFHKKN